MSVKRRWRRGGAGKDKRQAGGGGGINADKGDRGRGRPGGWD